jgi:bacterioferritin (cytochrome b1)
MAEEEEKLDLEAAIKRLNDALKLQYRSVNQYMLNSASLFGFEFQALGDRMWEFAQAELADARRLVEKIVALGGEPTTEVAPLQWTGAPSDAVKWLIDSEGEAVETLQAAIEPTGREGRSEALEHMLEHLIMRKQDQLDFLVRASRTDDSP